ncbi:MAG: hypothetical protein CM15mP18_5320 [Methanobacteriota archaeon]|nr:MAG: hypothetical protein CM15mP18_5320 [Euryarchaeota archaeon]
MRASSRSRCPGRPSSSWAIARHRGGAKPRCRRGQLVARFVEVRRVQTIWSAVLRSSTWPFGTCRPEPPPRRFGLDSSSLSEVWDSIEWIVSLPRGRGPLGLTLTMPFGVDVEGDPDLGHAAGAGGPTGGNWPSVTLSFFNRLALETWVPTAGWFSLPGEISNGGWGWSGFPSIIVVVTPPRVSMPRVMGAPEQRTSENPISGDDAAGAAPGRRLRRFMPLWRLPFLFNGFLGGGRRDHPRG